MWPFRFVAIPVCGRFGLWPFRSLAILVCGRFGLWRFGLWVSVCGRSGLWLFRFVAVSVRGRFGLWPFRFVAISVVAVSVCGRCDLLPIDVLHYWPFVRRINRWPMSSQKASDKVSISWRHHKFSCHWHPFDDEHFRWGGGGEGVTVCVLRVGVEYESVGQYLHYLHLHYFGHMKPTTLQ